MNTTASTILSALVAHNTARSEVAQMGLCANMVQLSWSNTLAQDVAERWVETCPTTLNPAQDIWFREAATREEVEAMCQYGDGYPCLGENILFVAPCPSRYCDPYGVFEAWYEGELVEPGVCKNFEEAGQHFSQVLWPTTRWVGCADQQGCDPWDYTLVCNYGPTGNIFGEEPCVEGPACSACPEDLPRCLNGLCVA